MFENKYGKFITVLLIALIIVILGVLGYLGYSVIRTFNLSNDAGEAANRFENQFIQNGTSQENTQTNTQTNTEIGDVTPDIAPENSILNGSGGGTSTSQEYQGFTVVGTIEIPSTGLKSVVLEKASADAIEVAVGIYAGPGLNRVGNTVIAGHNYRNGTFFSDNKKIVEGDKIHITDTTGQRVTYTVYNVYITTTQDGEYINRDTNGKREISLTTCTDDTVNRLIIWATED